MLRRLLLALTLATLPSVASANAFSHAQLSKAEASSVAIYGQETIIVSPYIEEFVGFYWKRVYNRPFCSGVVLWSRGTHEVIATARHCTMRDYIVDPRIDDPSKSVDPNIAVVVLSPQYIHFADGDIGHVHSYYESTNADVSVLDVTSTRVHPAQQLSARPLYRGQELLDFGMPGIFQFAALRATATQGTYALGSEASSQEDKAFVSQYHWQDAQTVDCPGCAPGVSGSGVSDQQGRVVGLLVGIVGSLEVLIPSPGVESALTQFATRRNRQAVVVPDHYDACLLGNLTDCSLYKSTNNLKEGDLDSESETSAAVTLQDQWKKVLTVCFLSDFFSH